MILKGKVAIITGSGQGIGKGIALRFAKEGAKVIINSRSANTVKKTAAEIRSTGGEALEVPADVTSEEQVKKLFETCINAYGTVDILVNNARTDLNLGERGPFLLMNSNAWQKYMEANLGALFFCTHYAAKTMTLKRSGSIINISTNGAVRAHRQMIAYDSSKGAMESFTRAVAIDLAPWQVRVNAIRPFPIRTEKWDNLEEAELAKRAEQVPLGRLGTPADVAWAAVFLAADDAAFITGQVFNVDGGMLEQSRPPALELGSVTKPEEVENAIKQD